MSLKFALLIGALLLSHLTARAQTSVEANFAEAMGLRAMLEQARGEMQAQIERTTREEFAEDLKHGLPYSTYRSVVAQIPESARRISSSWSADEAIAIYVKALRTQLDPAGFERLAEFVGTTEGRALLVAVQIGATNMRQYIAEATEAAARSERETLSSIIRMESKRATRPR